MWATTHADVPLSCRCSCRLRVYCTLGPCGGLGLSHMQMQQGLAGTQMLGIRALPSLLHVAAAQQHALAAATAAVHHQQQYQQPWQQQCLRSRCVCAAAALAEPLLEQQAADPYKPFFSSRAKIAEACVPWLKQSRTRCVRCSCCVQLHTLPPAPAAWQELQTWHVHEAYKVHHMW